MLITAAKASEAAEVLGVELNSLTPKGLTKAYRDKAKTCHPDHHGVSELQTWARVSWAKEALERWLKATPTLAPELVAQGDCRCCGGTGRVNVSSTRIGKPLTMLCVMCDGSGELRREAPDEMESR